LKNVGINVHNVLVITLMAALGIVIFRLAAKTPLANIPVVGDGVRLVAGA